MDIYDVGGTVEDVYKIDKDILYFCYDLFYHPKNMNFVIVGDLEPEEVFSFIENNQNKKIFKDFKDPKLIIDWESDDICKKFDCKQMDVVNQKVAIGFKLPIRKEQVAHNQLLIEDLYYRIIKNILFGGHTNFHQKLLDEKLISSPLLSSYSGDDFIQYFSIIAETEDSGKFVRKIKNRLNDLKRIKFNQKEVNRIKKDLIGKFIISLNSVSAIMGDYLESIARNYDYLDFINIVNSINIETLQEISKTLLDLPMSVYIIEPNKKTMS